jgi:hypothetical protein
MAAQRLSRRPHVRGYALLVALLALVAVSLAAMVAVHRARTEAQRERERQLLWVGNQYRQALWNYANLVGGNFGKQYPVELADLLEDKRMPNPTRFLRQLYPDPITGKQDWVLEREAGRIIGLHSSSLAEPLRRGGFGHGDEAFAAATSYSGWRFLASDASVAAVSVAGWGGNGAPGSSPSGIGTDASTMPGANTTQPVAATDPNLAARQNCYMQYQQPKSGCTQTPPPQGDNLISCMRAFAQQFNACIAAIGSGQSGGQGTSSTAGSGGDN